MPAVIMRVCSRDELDPFFFSGPSGAGPDLRGSSRIGIQRYMKSYTDRKGKCTNIFTTKLLIKLIIRQKIKNLNLRLVPSLVFSHISASVLRYLPLHLFFADSSKVKGEVERKWQLKDVLSVISWLKKIKVVHKWYVKTAVMYSAGTASSC